MSRMLRAVLMTLSFAYAAHGQLDETWVVKVNGQTVQVNPDGTFLVTNISAPDQFGPGGPGTAPDFISDDTIRVVAVSMAGGETRYAFSEPFSIRQGTTTLINTRDLTFTDTPPPFPVALRVAAAAPTLTEAGQTTQVTTTATLIDGSELDVTPRTSWTDYRVSNTDIITIDRDGLITAVSEGTAFVTATNEGATAVTRVTVSFGDELTSILGFVQLADGTPVEDADIAIVGLGGMGATDANGRFDISGIASNFGKLVILAQKQNGSTLFGITDPLDPVPGGLVDGGIITIRTICEALGGGCVDTDGDCVPDNIEAQLGLNPNSTDSDNDTIPDGAEDPDLDSLSTCAELFLGTTANNIDTDGDGLTDATEIVNGLDPTVSNLNTDLIYSGDFIVAANRTVTIRANWVIQGTTTVNGTLIVEGANASFTAEGPADVSNGRLESRAGGALTFPTVTEISGASLTVAAAMGGLVDLSALTSFADGTLTAIGTGMYNFDALASISNAPLAARDGAVLDLPLLTQSVFTSNNVSQPNLFLAAGTGPVSEGSPPAQLLVPNITMASFLEQACNGCTATASATVGGQIDLSGLTTINLPDGNDFFRFTLDSNGSIDLSNFALTARVFLNVSGTSALTLPAVDGNLAAGTFTLGGDAMLAFPNVDGVTSGTFNLSGNAGLTFDGATSFAGATVNLSGNSQLTVPDVTAVQNTTVNISGTSAFDAGALTAFTNSILTLNGVDAWFLAPNLTNVNTSRFTAMSGAVIDLSGVLTFMWVSNNVSQPTIFDAQGTGLVSQGSPPSTILAPNLESMSYLEEACNGCQATIRASAGGFVDLAALTSLTNPDGNDVFALSLDSGGSFDLSSLPTNSRLRVNVNGASTLELPAFTGTLMGGTFSLAGDAMVLLDNVDGVTSTTFNMSGNAMLELLSSASLSGDAFNLSGNAVVSLPLVTTIAGTNISLSNASTFSVPALTDFNTSNVTVRETSQFDAPVLTDIDTSTFRVESGAIIDLTGVTAYAWVTNNVSQPTIFAAVGTGPVSQGAIPSQILAGNITTLSYLEDACNGCAASITANTGGVVDLEMLTTVSFPDGNDFLNFNFDSGGTAILSNLVANARLRFNIAGISVLDLPGFSGTLTNATFTLGGDGVLNLGAVDAVNNSTFNMSGNASIEFDSSATFSGDNFNLSGNAEILLPIATMITGSNFSLSTNSLIDAPMLTDLTNSVVTVRETSQFNAPLLDNINTSTFAAESGAVIDLLAVTTYAWVSANVSQPTIFRASGTGPASQGSPPSTILASNIATLSYIEDACNGCTATINANLGGLVDLSALPEFLLPDGNDVFTVTLDSGGTADLASLDTVSRLRFNVNGTSVFELPGVVAAISGATFNIGGSGMVLVANAASVSSTSFNINTDGMIAFDTATTITGSNISLTGNAVFAATLLESYSGASVTMQQTSTFNAPAMTAFTSSVLRVLNAAQFAVPLLDDLSTSTFSAEQGAVIDLPMVTSYTWVSNNVSQPTVFSASGVGPASEGSPPSMVLLPNLATFSYTEDACNGCSAFIRANAGGEVDITGLTTITVPGNNDFVRPTADGAGSVIDASALTTFDPLRVLFQETNGGVILLP